MGIDTEIRKQHHQPTRRWFSTMLLVVPVLISFLLVLLFAGSFFARFFQTKNLFGLLGLGLLIAVFPCLFLNSLLTSLRVRFSKKHIRFGDTFLAISLFTNTTCWLLLVLCFPEVSSKTLKIHGNWAFGKQTANLLQIKESHPFLRKSRLFVSRLSYLLGTESRPWKPFLAKNSQAIMPSKHNQREKMKTSRVVGKQKSDGVKAAVRPGKQREKRELIHVPIEKMGSSLVVTLKLGTFRGKFLLDTGASYLSLTRKTAQKLGLQPSKKAPSLSLRTANGKLETPIGILPSLTIGKVQLKNVTFVLCDQCSDPSRGLLGLLGVNVMNRFRYTLDPKKGEILLEKTSSFSDQIDDIKRFVKLKRLYGETRKRFLRGSSFHLKGVLKNLSPLKLKNIRLKLQYLLKGKPRRTRFFSLKKMVAGYGSVSFNIQDTSPPNFKFFRVDIEHAAW